MGGKIALLTTLYKNINIRKCISIDLPPYETPELDPMILQNYDLIMRIIRSDVKILRGSPSWQKKFLSFSKVWNVIRGNVVELWHSTLPTVFFL